LFDIYKHFTEVAAHEVAEKLLLEIEEAIGKLKHEPFMGSPRDEIYPGLRATFAWPYVILYRVATNEVEIARVVHERRAPLSHDEV
jgi:plasmid stabilization system protein ParE